jgi:hypothetical protein
LHPLVESKRDVVEQRVQEDRSLDIFEMTTSTSELVTELADRQLLIFNYFQVDVKESSAHYSDGKNIKICFLLLVFVQDKS